jgi:FMN phosphatase YigB (HAD superfamily)
MASGEMASGKRKVFIFDLDDTLYQNDAQGQLINTVNRDLLEKLPGIRIVFSNANYNHCILWLNRLGIADLMTAIISCDIIQGYKPHNIIYHRLMSICNINLTECDIVFFDDLVCNLATAHALGWQVVYIPPFHLNIENASENIFSNINTAIAKYAQN